MRRITFDDEEMMLIAIFEEDSRAETLDYMRTVQPFMGDNDEEMSALMDSAIHKLELVTDEEFADMDLSGYLILEEEDEKEE